MKFEATAKFILLFDSSGWLRLRSISNSFMNLSMISAPRCLRFSQCIIAWCPGPPEPKRINRVSKIFLAVSRWYCFSGLPLPCCGECTAFLSLSSLLPQNATLWLLSSYIYNRRIHPYNISICWTSLRFLTALFGPKQLFENVSNDLLMGSNAVAIAVLSREYPTWSFISVVWGSGISFLSESLDWVFL